MPSLRHLFLLDKLREAAGADDPRQLQLVRDIIREIKLAQLRHVRVADDPMVLEALEGMIRDRREDLAQLQAYLDEANRSLGARED